MQISSALEAVRLKIIDLIAKNWDSAYLGSQSSYNIEPPFKKCDKLTVNFLHYPVKADWVYFTNNIAKPDVRSAFNFFISKNHGHANIIGGYEGGSDFSIALTKFTDALTNICNDSMLSGIAVRYANNKGLASEHVYVEFTLTTDENTEKLVLIMVCKNTQEA